MKQSNLISILILFFSLLCVQSVVAAEDGEGYFQEGTTWYTTKYTSEFNLGTYTIPKNLDINLKYPSDYVSFDAKCQTASSGNRTIYVDQYINGKWDHIAKTTENLSTSYKGYDANISPEATIIAFARPKSGTLSRYVKNIKVRMAPHIKMSTNSLEFDFNKDGTTKYTQKEVKFHSFLTAGTLTYSIVNKNDDNLNPYFTLYETKTVESNTFCSTSDDTKNQYNRTQYTFKVSFNPVEKIHGLYEARIKISDGTSTVYVNLSGKKHNQTISWDQNLTEMTLYEDIELTASASPDPQMPITYTWSPEDAFLCEGNRIIPMKIYENATITANLNGNPYYNSATPITKNVKIIKQERNSITWKYNFSNIGITENNRTYDLSTETYGAKALFGSVKYQIESNPDGLIELNGNTLIVKGNTPGTAVIKAYVEKTDDYLGTEMRKTIVASNSAFCNSIFSTEITTIESERSWSNLMASTQTTKTITFSNPITKITLEGYIGTTTAGSYGTLEIVGEKGESETLTFDENCKNWTQKSTTINFDRATRKVTLTAKTDFTFSIFIQNIQFHQAQYFELDDSDINFGDQCNALTTYNQNKTISFSDVQSDIYFALEHGDQGFSINTEKIEAGCETSNNITYTISFTPKEAGTYNDVLTISTGNTTKTIKLSGKSILNDHQFAWNTSDFEATYGDENIKFTPATDNANLSISYSSSDESVAKFIYNSETKRYEIQIVGVGTATLTAKAGNGKTYIEKTATKQIIVHKANQTIIWTNLGLTTADRQVKIAESDKQIELQYEIIEGQSAEATDNGTTISVVDAQTFKVRAYNDGSENYNEVSETKTINPKIGTIQFDNNGGNKNWNNSANWQPINTLNTQRNVEPSAVVNAEIAAEAKISSTNREEINNLTFVENGKLTINATSGLKANAVNDATAENLILKSSDEGNATFIYNSGTPSATVEMHSKAQYGTTATDGHHPEWQYMGVAVNKADENNCAKASNFSGAWLLKWDEAENVTGDPWSDEPLAAETAIKPWAGYSISQPTAKTYSMKGALMNGNHMYTLTRTINENATVQDPDCGFNLLANSYTAPIDITKLQTTDFSEKADACIVLFNTGTYADWESQTGKSGVAPGQLTVIPIEAAKAIAGDGLPTTIASMQAFFVMARENGATFTVDYQRAVAGATNHGNQMRAPEAQDEFNVLKIMIKGENSRDQLFLLENENTSKAYDNGYEARKIFDAPRGHQMYATCEYGYASIDCSKSFIGQAIGLKGDNEGEKLTISFGIDKIGDHESLFLYDKATGEYVNIMAEEEYTFYGIRGADDNRFCIVTNPDDRNQTPPFVVIGDELAFDKSQIGTDNANIYIYDTLGRLLMTDKVNPGENYRIPDMPEGIYLVSMNGYTTKIVRK